MYVFCLNPLAKISLFLEKVLGGKIGEAKYERRRKRTKCERGGGVFKNLKG